MEKAVIRNSNIELLRIIGMLMIVAHHFVINSGIMEPFQIGETSIDYIFLEMWGMWGKTGINIFIMISGYFMCKPDLTLKRYCKVLFEFLFYHFLIYVILLITGYETVGAKRLFDLFFEIFEYANESGSFTGSFLIFYLFIPFLNVFIRNASKKEFRSLVWLLLFVFTGLSTFFDNKAIFGEVFWFIAVYFIGAYFRIYPPAWSDSLKVSLRLLAASLILCYASVLAILFVDTVTHKGSPLYFVYDADKLGAVAVSVFLFTTFKNLPVSYSKVINLIAKTTFGVLMIHANSAAFRQFMWRDLLHVDTMSFLPFPLLVLNSVLIVAGVFIVCSLLDMIRIFTVEKYVFDHFEIFENLINTGWIKIRELAGRLVRSIVAFVER